jgi:D-alanyl-D-alanine-carboxypeptidase/D-alanyl-D-alanine-endopeptidase
VPILTSGVISLLKVAGLFRKLDRDPPCVLCLPYTNMKTLKLLLIICLILAFIVAIAILYVHYRLNHMTDQHNLEQQLDKNMSAFIKKERSYGLVIGVFKDQREMIKGYGSGKTGDEPPDEHSLFELASTSKLFTTSTLKILEDKQRLSIHDRLSKYLDERVSLPETARNTSLQHLATHRSGFPSLPGSFIKKMTDEANPYKDLTQQDLYDYLKTCEGKAPEGSFLYSNLGMGLLGHILELSEQRSYEQLVSDELLAPLNMSSTFITLPDSLKYRLVRGFNEQGAETPVWEDKVLPGAGSFLSTARDMMKFIRANLQRDYSVISPSLLQTHERQLEGETGLGWILPSYLDKKLFRNDLIIWHNGMAGGYASFLLINKTQNYGLILLSNKAEDVTALGMKLARIIKHTSWSQE